MHSILCSVPRIAGLVLVLGVAWLVHGVVAQDAEPAKKDSAERSTLSPRLVEFLKPLAMADGDDELTSKMKERHNVAVKLFEARAESFRRSLGTLDSVLDAARAVVDAKLDLADDRAAQLEVLDYALEIARLIEKHHQVQVDAGLTTTADLLRAQLARTSIEVQILKLKRQ